MSPAKRPTSTSRAKASARSGRAPGKAVPIGTSDSHRDTATAKTQPRRRPDAPKQSAESGESFRAKRLATSRYGIVYDIDGPRVRLGLAWFVAAVIATFVGLVPLTLLVAGIAALAAAQTAQTLRTPWRRPDRATAAVIAAAIPVAAAFGTALAGLVVVLGSFAAVFTAGARSKRRSDPLIDAGAVVRSAVFVGLAAASIVMLYRFDIGAAVTLLLLLSAYETGDYLIGSGASNVVEGPFAGFLAIVVVTGALAVIQPPPFTGLSLWFYAVVAAVTAPVGQVLASAILPRAGAPAPALRRLDSYLFAGPAWLLLLWSGVGI